MRSDGPKPPGQPARRAHAPPAALDGADAPRAGDHQPARGQRARSGAMPYPHPVLPAAACRPAADGRARAVPRRDRRPEFVDRDARLVDLLARKAAGIIESNYDAMSGLYTRPAFEQRVRAVVTKPQRTHAGARCTSTPTSCTSSTTTSACTSATASSASSASSCAAACRPALSPRASPATASRCCCRPALEDAAQFAESLREGAEQLGALQGEVAPARLDQHRRRAARYRSRRADAFARRRRDGLQGRQGSRPQSRRGLSAERSQHRAPLRRHQHRRAPARRDHRGPPAPRRAAHPAASALRRARASRTTNCCCA